MLSDPPVDNSTRKIAITGALGHIGSRLLRSLTAEFPGVELVLVDNLATQRQCSLENLPPGVSYRFFEADVLTADLAALFSGAGVVIHLAAMTNPEESAKHEGMVDRVNRIGTERVARACMAAGSKMLFVSTTSVYGPASGILDESRPIADLRPENPYARSKLKSEQLLNELAASEGLRHITCRFATIFGTSPGMRFHTAINRFCLQAATGAPLTVWRTAMHQRRPYLDLGDAAAAMAFLVRRGTFDGELFNVLTLNTTVAHVVDAIAAHVSGVRIDTVDSPVMSEHSYEVDRTRLDSLGFECRGSISEGVRQTLEWLRSNVHVVGGGLAGYTS